MLLSICLNFCQFQPGVACKSVAYKRKRVFFAFITDCLIHCSLLSVTHPICNFKCITFLIIPLHNISKSFPFCFAFGLVNSLLDFIFASIYFFLLVFPYFHFLHSLRVSLTAGPLFIHNSCL